MRKWLLVVVLGSLGGLLSSRCPAAEPLTALDLVSADVALCLAIPNLDQNWATIQSSPVINRLQTGTAYQNFLESPAFSKWKSLNDYFTRSEGATVSERLRAAFARSFVLAIYVPPQGEPRGILIGEAADAESVRSAYASWNKLEPKQVTTPKSFQGYRYYQRKRHPNDRESLYTASASRWFAISDHEPLIQDVISRFVAATQNKDDGSANGSLRQSTQFQRNRDRLNGDHVAILHLNARPWDRGLEEASRGANPLFDLATPWKYVSSLTAGLKLDQGIVCDAVIDLDPSNLPADWSKLVAISSSNPAWGRQIPGDAMLAFGGHFEIGSVSRQLATQFPLDGRSRLSRNRRLARSLFAGLDLFDDILPAMARDVCGYLTTRQDAESQRMRLDGILSSRLDSSAESTLGPVIGQGLETALNLAAADISSKSQNVVFVQREQSGTAKLRWLSDAAPMTIAFGQDGSNLVIAGTQPRLVSAMQSTDDATASTRFTKHSRRHFPEPHQFVWFDLVQARTVLKNNGADVAKMLDRNPAGWQNWFERIQPTLEMTDSFFISGRNEADHIRLTVGGGLDDR